MESEILVEGMEFHAFHGFYPEEQKVGCKYTVDLALKVDFSKASNNDELDDTINYEKVYVIVKEEMQVVSKLIEQVGARILERLKKVYPQITRIDLKLYKYNPPLGGSVKRVGIHLVSD